MLKKFNTFNPRVVRHRNRLAAGAEVANFTTPLPGFPGLVCENVTSSNTTPATLVPPPAPTCSSLGNLTPLESRACRLILHYQTYSFLATLIGGSLVNTCSACFRRYSAVNGEPCGFMDHECLTRNLIIILPMVLLEQ